ncbi:GDSL esterase/lipase At5g22810-like [Lotus japonicus]|uniref:GDSL esterase/lipase At5g22810-like n=1 Tax=Lotus japonicus TaxID=34305 RepID=UPI002590C3B3|nr:GDSL esterase/lipase At5g22810-like [Lotus japonicus]
MGYSSFLLISILFLTVVLNVANGQPLVPAMFLFGDSSLDVGNNNHLLTVVKANFPPYGRDFENHIPTGRFSNGKLPIDFAAETFGFTSYPPAYLNLKIKGNNLLYGANFASAGSGYSSLTSKLDGSISLNKQLEYYMEYQKELVSIAGPNASSIISGALYLIGAGTCDFMQNYFVNPLLKKLYTVDQFSDILIGYCSNFIQNLYALGARRIVLITIPPIGCFPAAITIFGLHSNECVPWMNSAALNFNKKLNTISQDCRKMLPGINLVILDTYQTLYDMVTKPSDYGFFEVRKGCCGTGVLETVLLCNHKSIGTCANASKYVFWDSIHPTEAANKILADDLIAAGKSLIS